MIRVIVAVIVLGLAGCGVGSSTKVLRRVGDRRQDQEERRREVTLDVVDTEAQAEGKWSAPATAAPRRRWLRG
jgi:uncharacterized lipoprotein